MLIQWSEVGVTQKYNIDDLRSKLGVEPKQYKTMCNFKIKVLDKAINQINEHTDITVKYEQHKTGRKITAISFSFKQKRIIEHIKSSNDSSFIKLTDSQIRLFSGKLARLPELGNDAPQGRDFDHYATVIADHLADENQQKKYMPYLTKVGYQPSKHKV